MSPRLQPAPSAAPYGVEEEPLLGSLLASSLLHASLLFLLLFGARLIPGLLLGGTHLGGAGAGTINAQLVSAVPGGAVPMPAPVDTPTQNRLANDNPGTTISQPRPAARPPADAVTLPSRRKPDPKLAQQQALRALDQLAVADRHKPDNRVAYGQGGAASFDYSMTSGVGGNGGMAFGDASFGNLYAAYVNHLRDRLAFFWNREYRDPSLPAGRLVYVRFNVDRSGRITNIGFAQPSNVPALDSRALHAVQVLAETERLPLPSDYPRSSLDVRVSFALQ
ncbi:MAG: TonB family protein [Terriglobales bacterium]